MTFIARNGSRTLSSLTPSDRADIILTIADLLIQKEDEILAANKLDLDAAQLEGVTGPLFSRLAITRGKLESLATGLRQIADASYENVGKVIRKTKVSDTLSLVQRTVPIGVLMVIFESRPDALPQVNSKPNPIQEFRILLQALFLKFSTKLILKTHQKIFLSLFP